jgi:transposase
MKSSSPHPIWAVKHRTPGTELRLIKGKYYLYSVSSKWDSVKKKSVKITGQILGRITEDAGFVPSEKARLKKIASDPFALNTPSIYEFGASRFILDLANVWLALLNKHFGEDAKLIFVLAFIRLAYQSAIKNMPLYLNNSYLKTHFNITNFTDKSISDFLNKLGQNRNEIVNFMQSFMNESKMVLIDMTDITSYSKKMDLPHIGYNNRMDFNPQVNLLYIFTAKEQMPTYYRLVAGNIKDVKAFALSIKESGLRNAIVVADKGFYSTSNINLVKSEKLKIIIPLRRDNSLIDYSPQNIAAKNLWDGNFKYNDKFIWYHTSGNAEQKVYLYLDDTLRVEEEHDYLNRVEKKPEKYSMEGFMQKQRVFGTIAILVYGVDMAPREIYEDYKSRNNIEVMYDAYKNVLQADRTYMQNEKTLEGWQFINHIAMQWYYLIYHKLKQTNLLKKYSVADILLILRQIKKIKVGDNMCTAEITKATSKLLDQLNLPIT